MPKANLFLKYDSTLCIQVWKVWNWKAVGISLLFWSKYGLKGLFPFLCCIIEFCSSISDPPTCDNGALSSDRLIYFFKGERGSAGGRGQSGDPGPKGAKVRRRLGGKTKLRVELGKKTSWNIVSAWLFLPAGRPRASRSKGSARRSREPWSKCALLFRAKPSLTKHLWNPLSRVQNVLLKSHLLQGTVGSLGDAGSRGDPGPPGPKVMSCIVMNSNDVNIY